METNRSYALAYTGNGFDLFKIQIVNLILTTVTLGFYYPWAKAKTLQYLYSSNTFEGYPFAFTGTGAEMFKGFIKAVLIFIGVYGIALLIIFLGRSKDNPAQTIIAMIVAMIWMYGVFLSIIPIALYGFYKYRMAKTNWRGIRFGYHGDQKELILLFVKGFLLTLFTFGIYGAWFTMSLRRYIISRIKVGNAEFQYNGEGIDYFLMVLKGYFLTLFTFGIYFFWWQRDLFAYFIDNLKLTQNDKEVHFASHATAGGFFRLFVGNYFLVLFTLGLGMPWALTRTFNYITSNIAITGDVAFEELEQTEPTYSDATGEDLGDMLHLGAI